MFAEWVTTGVSWGIMIASAAVTLFAVMGFVIGIMSIIAFFIKGGQDEDKKDMDDIYKDNRPKRG